jgi:hypothetical protein
MEPFAQFGTEKGEDLQHAKTASLADFPHHAYAKKAEAFLAAKASAVLGAIQDILTSIEGKWNPGGFMVFPLGLLEDGCSLRLHVWPRGMERDTDQGPNPHNHTVHLTSRIILGRYSDVIFDVDRIQDGPESASDALNLPNIYRLYATYRGPAGKDNLKAKGTLVRVTPREYRIIRDGETHHIPAGEYHASEIPTNILTASLVLDSPSFRESSDVLLKSSEPDIRRVRKAIDAEQLQTAMNQITDYLRTR